MTIGLKAKGTDPRRRPINNWRIEYSIEEGPLHKRVTVTRFDFARRKRYENGGTCVLVILKGHYDL